MRLPHAIGFRRPLLHGLIARAVDVNLLIYARDPANWHEVMLAVLVLGQFDRRRTLHMIHDGELAALRANDGHVGLD